MAERTGQVGISSELGVMKHSCESNKRFSKYHPIHKRVRTMAFDRSIDDACFDSTPYIVPERLVEHGVLLHGY